MEIGCTQVRLMLKKTLAIGWLPMWGGPVVVELFIQSCDGHFTGLFRSFTVLSTR